MHLSGTRQVPDYQVSAPLRLTLKDYHAMIERGGFDPVWHKHIELLNGELHQSPAPTPYEASTVSHLTAWLYEHIGDAACVRCRAPLTIVGSESEPEPDVTVVEERDYDDRHPYPEETLLLVQVTQTTLAFDLSFEAMVYGQAGIADYWVVDLVNRIVHIFRQPSASGYGVHEQISAGEVSPLAFPAVKLPLAELFA